MRPRRIHLLAFGALAAFALACGAPKSDNTSGSGSGATAGSGVSTQAAAASEGKLNQPVRDGDFEFVVSKVECSKTHVGPASYGATAQGVYCMVTVSTKNIGDKAQTFFGTNQKAYAGKVEYSTDTTASIYIEGNEVFIKEINPGNTAKGVLVFDVPKGTTLTTLELHDSAFSGGVTVTL